MPFIGEFHGDRVVPEQVTSDTIVACPSCEEEMYVRGPVYQDGSFIAPRHFVHYADESCQGESDEHRRAKSIAASKARDKWPDAEVGVETGIGNRRVDVLVEFASESARFGEGVCIEIQHKNYGKDKAAVESEYAAHEFTTLWLDTRHFEERNVKLLRGTYVNPLKDDLLSPRADGASDHRARYEGWREEQADQGYVYRFDKSVYQWSAVPFSNIPPSVRKHRRRLIEEGR